MKRMFLSALLICLSVVSFTQTMTQQQILDVINRSKEVNQKNGVVDPNRIKTGQVLTFRFQDGTEKEIIVETGDSQWSILEDKLPSLIQKHGPVVPYSDTVAKKAESLPVSPVTTDSKGNGFPLLWVLVVIGAVCLIAYLLHRKSNERVKSDPVTSGPAMRRDGVSDSEAYSYASQVAARTFNSPQFTVTNVERGTLSGTNVSVYYAGKATPERKTFTNITAYRGTIQREGTQEYVYFLQGCGNDVRVGNYLTGSNIQFIPEVGHVVPVPTPATDTNLAPSTEEAGLSHAAAHLSKAVLPLVQALVPKTWGKVLIETEGARFEMNFGENKAEPKHEKKEELAASIDAK